VVNALSNIKRALDCQIELIICEHGFGRRLKEERWRFPRKIHFLKEYQIIAPRILEKINRTRNVLEHEFKLPSLEQVEDAYDVVLLFVGYTENLRRVPDSIAIGFETSSTTSYTVVFDKEVPCFHVLGEAESAFTLEEGEEGFDRLLRLFHGTQPATWRLVHRRELEETGYRGDEALEPGPSE
jgi:hypothetical protein